MGGWHGWLLDAGNGVIRTGVSGRTRQPARSLRRGPFPHARPAPGGARRPELGVAAAGVIAALQRAPCPEAAPQRRGPRTQAGARDRTEAPGRVPGRADPAPAREVRGGGRRNPRKVLGVCGVIVPAETTARAQ